ncbi:hypothetical protein VDG1235_42 [Verrucomicrobiia bacterium DG1235]|nr:hypothetical protein VDG1235_42 [Verrucomicrobiae bacterium DG1235]
MKIDEPTSRSLENKETDCRVIGKDDALAWDEAIQAIDEASRFLCSDWTQLLQDTYGYEPKLIVLKENDEISGVMPFVIVRSVLTGTRGISLPFFDICRSYSKSPQQIGRLYEAFIAEGKRQNWDYLELRGDIEKLRISEPSLSFYNHVVDLSQGPDKVFANMASSNRRAVRKAEKLGLRIEFSDTLEAIKGFYSLQCITRKRHGLPPQPFRFFKNLHQALIQNGKGTVLSAFRNDNLAASGIYLEQGNFVHYKYGASDTRYQDARCNNLVMWNALKLYSERGFDYIDLGRNSLENEGLRKYKLSWGSEERITHYHRYDLKNDSIMTMSDDVYGWHNAIFGKLPKPLAQLTGSLIYKHIA